MILTVHPDSRRLTLTDQGADIGCADLPAALNQVRLHWCWHQTIAQMPKWSVVAADPSCAEARDIIEDRMAEIMLDLGNSTLDTWIGARNALRNQHQDEPKQNDLPRLTGRTVIALASGPSANLDRVRQIQHQGAVVVCADSIYRGAVAAGISPDYVCVLERDERIAEYVPADICATCTLVAPPVIDPVIAAPWKGRRVWWWQAIDGLYQAIGPGIPMMPTGRSAGTFAVAVACALKPERVVLMGHDLVMQGETSHATAAGMVPAVAHVRDVVNEHNTYHRPAELRCHDGKYRPSTLFWSGCRTDIETIISQNHQKCTTEAAESAYIVGVGLADTEICPHFSQFSRYSSKITGEMMRNINAFLSDPPPHGYDEPSYIAEAAAHDPANWPDIDQSARDVLRYVLAPAFHAMSIRSARIPDRMEALRSSVSLLRRRVRETLVMVAHDLRAMS